MIDLSVNRHSAGGIDWKDFLFHQKQFSRLHEIAQAMQAMRWISVSDGLGCPHTRGSVEYGDLYCSQDSPAGFVNSLMGGISTMQSNIRSRSKT